jgi:hypothetical protein
MRVVELDEVDRPGRKNRRAFRLPRLAHHREQGEMNKAANGLVRPTPVELSHSFITDVMKPAI